MCTRVDKRQECGKLEGVDKFDVLLLCVMGGVRVLSYVSFTVSFWALAWDFL